MTAKDQPVDERIASMVSKWFGEPVLSIEDEIKELCQAECNKARIKEVEYSVGQLESSEEYAVRRIAELLKGEK